MDERNGITPPAIVKQAHSIVEEAAAIAADFKGYQRRDQELRRRYYERCEALRERCKAERTNWLPILEKTEIPQSTFSDWCQEFRTKPAAETTESGSEVDKPGSKLEPIKSVFCDRCNRLGAPVKDCQACQEVRGRKAKEKKQDKPKSGKPTFEWKLVEEPFSKLVRGIDLLGNAFQCKESPAVEAVRKKFDEAHHDLKAIYQRKGKDA